MRKNFVSSGVKGVIEMQTYSSKHFIGPVEAYIVDYKSSFFPTTNWICSNTFDLKEDIGYPGGPLTRQEMADLYTKSWTVYLEGRWRNRLRDDTTFAMMLREKIIDPPEGWGEGFKL